MSKTTKHTITLRGCDDMTTVHFDLTDAEVALLKRIAAATDRESVSSCMPDLHLDALCPKHRNVLMRPDCWMCEGS